MTSISPSNIPVEAVEAAARAHYDSSPTHRARWVQLSVGHKRELMAPIRAALEAAAPHLMAAAWERGYLFSYYQERGWTDDGTAEVPEHLVEYLAEWNPHREP